MNTSDTLYQNFFIDYDTMIFINTRCGVGVRLKTCTFCVPEKGAFFRWQFKNSLQSRKKWMYTFFAHFVHPKSVPSFTSECEQLQNYFERLAHFTVPTMYAFFLTIPFRKSTLARNFQKVERKLLNFFELSFKVLKPSNTYFCETAHLVHL